LLSDEETETIFNKATDCAEGECSLDDVNDLLSELNAQQKILSDRLAQVTNMIDTLAGVNDKEEREVDEVRQYVRDLLRVFNNDKPMFSPTGYSGDISSKTMTAYDALPPKPMKKQ